MDDLLIGLGVLLAVLGPILTIPVIWALYRFALKPFFGPGWKGWALAIALVVTVLTASYLPGKRAFDDRCEAAGPPAVSERVEVGGFYRTAAFPYEAANYIVHDGFEYVEAPDPYKDDVIIRYTLASDGAVKQEEVGELRSKYGVKRTYALLDDGVSVTEKVVYEIATGRELARAAEYVYHGGPLAVFLGSMSMDSCPDPRTPEGSRQFGIFYDLEKIVLQGEPLP